MPDQDEEDRHIHVFVGCDQDGDYCLYVKRGPCDGSGRGYLDEDELQSIAGYLEGYLNSTERT